MGYQKYYKQQSICHSCYHFFKPTKKCTKIFYVKSKFKDKDGKIDYYIHSERNAKRFLKDNGRRCKFYIDEKLNYWDEMAKRNEPLVDLSQD